MILVQLLTIRYKENFSTSGVRCVGGGEDRRKVAHMPQHVEAREQLQVSALLLL